MAADGKHLSGSCLCGLVTYDVPDAFEYALYCHCSDCRRTTGAAAKPFAGIGSQHLHIVQGADRLMRHGDGTHTPSRAL